MSPLVKVKIAGIVFGVIYVALIIVFLCLRNSPTVEIDWSYWFTLYNAIIVFTLLWLGFKEMVAKGLDAAAADTAKKLKEARAANNSAREFEDYEAEMEAQLEAERTHLMSSLTAQIASEKQAILASAHADAQQTVADIEREAAAEVERVKKELRNKLLNAAFAEAEKTVHGKLTDADRKKVFDDILKTMTK
ncbi:hypothetical protein FACS1894139_16720 [Planctomycetales bacterium]|nr:hypothetical protein FACS1894107_12580 [Planctomycetales bacterium]GHS98731.1 hypothetical protein FACS1894108_07420 [Planctomycetales bacterium]GHT07839.1 hypothetical protein FACS1894139_16720 [Planctomycetales bacterium]GHV23838.1 hypothetical protein AGMMS49959_18330 [Planctomycetales bacterium]